jgi:hypothetical protein
MKLRWLALCACVLSFPSVSASAQSKDQPVSGYMVCTIIEKISRPFAIGEGATTGDASRILSQWRDAAQRWNGGRCFYGTRAEMEEEFATQHRKILAAMGTPGIVDFRPDWSRIIPSSRRGGKAPRAAPAEAADKQRPLPRQSTTEAVREAELARTAAREAREAEFQAKVAAHEARVAEYQSKVKAREAEIDRQQALHADAQDAAARKIEEHRRQLAEANRRQQEYFAAQRRHALCVGGDQKACADIAAGKPALGEQLAGTGEASTDTDANRCVTTAEVRTNANFQGNTAASVMNGCGQPVDVRICLKRGSDWNCGTKWGVGSQEQASHSSFNATGEVFVDARVAGSNRPLASP